MRGSTDSGRRVLKVLVSFVPSRLFDSAGSPGIPLHCSFTVCPRTYPRAGCFAGGLLFGLLGTRNQLLIHRCKQAIKTVYMVILHSVIIIRLTHFIYPWAVIEILLRHLSFTEILFF